MNQMEHHSNEIAESNTLFTPNQHCTNITPSDPSFDPSKSTIVDSLDCVIILYFIHTDEKIIFDTDNIPNIEPLNAMIKNFKFDSETIFESIRFKKYNIEEGNKNILDSLIKIVNKNYSSITDENIKEIIRLADYYLIDIEYDKIDTNILKTLITSLTNDDIIILCKLFRSDFITNKYMRINYLNSFDINTRKELVQHCRTLYYDQLNQYVIVNNYDDWRWLSKEKGILSAVSSTRSDIKKEYKNYGHIFKCNPINHGTTFSSCIIQLINKNDSILNCVFFNKNKYNELIFDNNYVTTDGVYRPNKYTLIFTIDTTNCENIYFTYQTTPEPN